MSKCENCIHNEVCDHNRFGYENCNSFKDKSLCVEPPVKVGDIVFIPSFFDKIVKEFKVISIYINKYGEWFSLDIDNPYISRFPFECVNKTVFLTEEEAEKELEKRNAENK